VTYRGTDGQELKGWVMLPFGYQEGTRYPVVAWVYYANVYDDDPPTSNYISNSLLDVTSGVGLNLQLLGARGYAVLFPSMPTQRYGLARDPYLNLTKGVIPALDKLVDMGIADPNRLGVMGHSYGGYSTYGLIEQTTRFKAAIALAGPSNEVSWYGTLDSRHRYDPFVHEYMFRVWNVETDMGSPPWKDLGRFIRNSPINYVDRVETPILIIQGDLDGPTAIQQTEEFFTAMYRQGKRAQFVRYWGEDHVIDSPANVRDMWGRIYAWLDEFLGPNSK
jgi:dipeptidyl aminopeptidase/acylaminoacyl peptidase